MAWAGLKANIGIQRKSDVTIMKSVYYGGLSKHSETLLTTSDANSWSIMNIWSTAEKMNFFIKISSLNVTTCEVYCQFGHSK